MTNRDRAIDLWRKAGGLDGSFRPEDFPEEVEVFESALNEAEQRGHSPKAFTVARLEAKIEALEELGKRVRVVRDYQGYRDLLARLRAEQTKGQGR